MINRFFTSLILFILIFSAQAQQEHVVFEHLTLENGLKSSMYTSGFKDSKGFMWFGGFDGYCKYDGYDIKNYKMSLTDSSMVMGKRIITILEDKHGNIWMSTDIGINVIDKKTGKISHMLFQADSLYNIGSTRLINDPYENVMWIGNADGLMKYNYDTKKFKAYKHNSNDPNSIGSEGIMYFTTSKKGDLWLCSWDNGISKYNREADNFTHYLHDPNVETSIFKPSVYEMVADDEDGIWVVSFQNENVARLDTKTGKFTHLPKFFPVPPRVLDKDKYGNIWVGLFTDGVAKYDVEKKEWVQFKHSDEDPESLSENRTAKVYYDNADNLWIFTLHRGINKLNLLNTDIYYYETPTIKHHATTFFPSITVDQNKNVWSAFDGKVFKYNIEKKAFTSIVMPDLLTNKSPQNAIEKIVPAQDGKVWASSASAIYTIDINTNKVEKIKNPYFTINNVSMVHYDKYGNFYICVNNKILIFKGGNLNSKPIEFDFGYKQTLDAKYMNCFFIDEGDIIWITLQSTFLKINTKTLTGEDVGSINNVSRYKYSSIYKAKNIIYLHSSSGYLTYDTDTKAITENHFSFLAENEVSPGGYNLNDSLICLSTYRGVFIYNLKNNHYVHPEIFNSTKINPDHLIKSSQDKLYMLAGNGFISFNPMKLYNVQPSKPNLVISDFYLFNDYVTVSSKDSPLKEDISEAKEIELTYKQSVFSFEMILLNYDDVKKNQYAYILDGFEKQWNYIGSRKVATYTNIPPGKYTFKYKATDRTGYWTTEKQLIVIIHPPFWGTWWFRVLMFSLVCFIIYLVIMLRTRAISKQKIVLEEQVITRTAEIFSQKEEILSQKEALQLHEQKISELYKDVTDSIQTAQRIQEGILPPNEFLKNNLSDSFVLYLPKDIVSGDFYWFYAEQERYYIAAIDCTGHGVAGAFMSLIAYNLLNRIVREEPGLTPDKLLDRLSRYIIQTLNQESEHPISKDGMDASVCMIDTKKNQIHFAGANNPLYLIRNGVIEITKADPNSVGIQLNKKISHFTNHVIDVQPDDRFYLFSDGFASQFGGPKGDEKLKYQRFRETLLVNHIKPMLEQKELLNQYLKNWNVRADEQTDDIMVIGFKL